MPTFPRILPFSNLSWLYAGLSFSLCKVTATESPTITRKSGAVYPHVTQFTGHIVSVFTWKLSSSPLLPSEKRGPNWILTCTWTFWKQSQDKVLCVKTWTKRQSILILAPVPHGYRNLEEIPKKNLEPNKKEAGHPLRVLTPPSPERGKTRAVGVMKMFQNYMVVTAAQLYVDYTKTHWSIDLKNKNKGWLTAKNKQTHTPAGPKPALNVLHSQTTLRATVI